jgi:hypothetical protein
VARIPLTAAASGGVTRRKKEKKSLAARDQIRALELTNSDAIRAVQANRRPERSRPDGSNLIADMMRALEQAVPLSNRFDCIRITRDRRGSFSAPSYPPSRLVVAGSRESDTVAQDYAE